MDYFIRQVVNGLQLGFIYALIALGYTMIYGVIKLINFAHGDVFMVGAFLSYYAITRFHLGFGGAMAFSVVGAIALGLIIERLAYKPLRHAPRLSLLTTALAVSIFLEYFCSLNFMFGPDYLKYPRPFPVTSWNLLGLEVSNVTLIVVGGTLGSLALLYYIVNRTRVGIAMRAVAFDQETARLMGIKVDFIISFTFALGSGLAGASAVMYAMAYPQIWTFMGIMPGLKAFVAAVLGGIGSVPGAVVGGLILGIVEVLTTALIPTLGSTLKDAIAFSILIVVLVTRPTGIFGEPG